MDRAAVLLAFEQVGGADRALEMAKSYALERYAFGRPIGSYQAIKHKLADIYIKNELARSNAYYGAWALDDGAAELPLAAAAARVAACEAFWFAAKENLQTHGGMGFTWEVDCHLFYRRAQQLAWSPAAPRPGKSAWSASSNAATPPDQREARPWISTTRPKKPPIAPRRAPGWRPTRPRRARGRDDRPGRSAATWRRRAPGSARRPRPATPASPGPRNGAAAAARPGSR